MRTGEGAWHLPGCGGMSDLTAAHAGALRAGERPASSACQNPLQARGGSAVGLLA